MEEETSYLNSFEVKPITKSCSSTISTKIQNDSSVSANIDNTTQQTNIDASYDKTIEVKPLQGGNNFYGIKNYEIIYKMKKVLIKTEDIHKALLYIIKNANINHDCLFQVKIKGTRKYDIYHFKNNKRKVINKIN